jgi:hypothetical protein
MNLVRCRNCAEVIDHDRDRYCMWCGAELSGAPAAGNLKQSEAQRTAKRDTRVTTIILAVIGALGVLGTIMGGMAEASAEDNVPTAIFLMLIGGLFMATIIWAFVHGRHGTEGQAKAAKVVLGCAAGIGGIVTALVALLIGGIALLFIACFTGEFGFA